MPPPTAANMPSLSPAANITGPPRQEAINRAPAMGRTGVLLHFLSLVSFFFSFGGGNTRAFLRVLMFEPIRLLSRLISLGELFDTSESLLDSIDCGQCEDLLDTGDC